MGFKLTPHYASSDTLLTALSPILDGLSDSEKARFNLERLEAFALTINTDDGFVYALDPTNLSVTFKHRMRAKPTSAGLPIMEMLSEARPFTVLLPQAFDRLCDVALRTIGKKDRTLSRIGVVTHTILSEDDMPPGVAKLAYYMGRPWKGELNSYNMQISAVISEKSGYVDRCIFHLVQPEDKEQLNNFVFDYQRVFNAGQVIDRRNLDSLTEAVSKSALDYFEQIAEGSQWDEDIISGAAQ